jgi:radical SAM superfamily enzyme YgiQ (UPF0313 family)
MNVLLFSMPDATELMPALAIRMPNGALTSLAGNVDEHHRVAVADLILAQDRVGETVTRLVRDHRPDLVGLSVMTFQRRTALRLIALVRSLAPAARIVVGGYDPSLAAEAYSDPESGVDFIVRGEGEVTFRELVRAVESGSDPGSIPGLSYRDSGVMRHNGDRPVSRLGDGDIRPPDRRARVLQGYTILGRQVDVVETSRGCTFDCSFCSIIEMRGRNFHTFSVDRAIADIADAHRRGARAIFLVDDNITLNVARFKALCEAIIDAGLNRIDYVVQAMTSPIAMHGDTLAPLMRRAGFRYVFLGIENVMPGDLAFLRAAAKNALRDGGRTVGNAAVAAIEHIHRNGMFVVGGLIVGNPDDTREAVEANLAFASRYVDWPYIQHPTPYPRTPMTVDFFRQGLIVNRRMEEYDGTTAVVRTRHMAAADVEFMRWRAERWMKLRHMRVAFTHSPSFVATHAVRMLRYTFRGTTLRTWLKLEPEREAFERYKRMRERERQYLQRPHGSPGAPDRLATSGSMERAAHT